MIEKILSVGLIIALLLYLDGLFLTRRELGIRATEDHVSNIFIVVLLTNFDNAVDYFIHSYKIGRELSVKPKSLQK
jgi:hypothetical protein